MLYLKKKSPRNWEEDKNNYNRGVGLLEPWMESLLQVICYLFLIKLSQIFRKNSITYHSSIKKNISNLSLHISVSDIV
jgi:hypothetical protein